MEAWRGGLSSLSHRGLHECSRCGEGKRKRGGPGWETIPPHSASAFFFFFLNIKVLLLWASQLREYACVRACLAKRTQRPSSDLAFTSILGDLITSGHLGLREFTPGVRMRLE